MENEINKQDNEEQRLMESLECYKTEDGVYDLRTVDTETLLKVVETLQPEDHVIIDNIFEDEPDSNIEED